MLQFDELVANAITALKQEVDRSIDWLENDRPRYWQEQVRLGFDRVAAARSNLESCRTKTVGGTRSSCIEEKEALRIAKLKLEMAQEKVQLVRRWAIKLREEADEYRGRIGQFETYLVSDFPKSLALLERTLQALEEYVSIESAAEAELPPPPPKTETDGSGD